MTRKGRHRRSLFGRRREFLSAFVRKEKERACSIWKKGIILPRKKGRKLEKEKGRGPARESMKNPDAVANFSIRDLKKGESQCGQPPEGRGEGRCSFNEERKKTPTAVGVEKEA